MTRIYTLFDFPLTFTRHNVFTCVGLRRNFASSVESGAQKSFRIAMQKVPQPVVVVTASSQQAPTSAWLKRGVTCSSFTSVSAQPPIVSFAITQHSRMHPLLLSSKQFAVHLLSKTQVNHAVHFAKPVADGEDQFAGITHSQNELGVPILPDVSAVLLCHRHQTAPVGDHHVWYGFVQRVDINAHVSEPMLYYQRSFRSVGDETFLQAFEERTLPFEDWTHEAHTRMAWNYINEYGLDEAVPRIKNGIMKFNELNKEKISRGYHETVTMFYVHMIHRAVQRTPNTQTFDEFLAKHPYLLEKNLLFEYYSRDAINSPKTKAEFVPPNLKSFDDLPSSAH